MNKQWLFFLVVCCLAGGSVIFLFTSGEQKHNAAVPPVRIERIVSLAPNITEIIFAMGLGEKIVAVSTDSDYPLETTKKTKVGTFWQPDIEAIIASKPDLVISETSEQQKSVADSLSRLGYNVLILRIEKIEELFGAIQKIGSAAGFNVQADELIKNLRYYLEELQSKLSSARKVKVLWVIQTEPLRVASRNTFINQVIELAGGENVIGSTIQKYPQVGTEELLACRPEVILQSAMNKTNFAQEQKTVESFWSRLSVLPAVKDKRIYIVDPDITLRLGPRLPQGVEMIARYLHPDVLPPK